MQVGLAQGDPSLNDLPFDHYERYKLTQVIASVIRAYLKRERLSVLDVGGAPGSLLRFLPGDNVFVLDFESLSLPGYIIGSGCALPFKDSSIDLVTCHDTLEHVPGNRRREFVEELLRVAGAFVMINGPFADPRVEAAERLVTQIARKTVGEGHPTLLYLAEHVALGLPRLDETLGLVDRSRLPRLVVANGALDEWLVNMGIRHNLLALAHRGFRPHEFDRFSNARFALVADGRSTYRQAIVIAKAGPSGLQLIEEKLKSLVPASEDDPFSVSIDRVVGSVGEYSKLVEEALEGKEKALEDKERHIGHLEHTIEQLAELRAALSQLEADLTVKEALLTETENHLRELQMHLQVLTGALGYRLLERVRRIINSVAPRGSRRRRTLAFAKKAVHLASSQGWLGLLRRAPQVWRWGPKLFRAISAKPDAPLTLDDQYQLWLRAHQLTPSRVRTIKRVTAAFAYDPKVSIIVPVYNPKPAWLRQAIESVRSQLYDNWELCIADDASTKPAVTALLEEYRMDNRIKVVRLENNQGISAASNAALALASGEFIGLLDHDDELKPDALYEVVSLVNRDRDLDFIYSDEDKKAPDGRLVQAFFKPDWSPELLLSTNYVPHFAVYRKSVVDEVGGWRSECDFSQDYDLALRVTERTDRIAHIPLPLYSWRMVPGSAASELKAKPKSVDAGKRALEDAMERRGVRAVVEEGPHRNTYRLRHCIEGQPLVSIIIPTRDRLDMLRPCITSIERKSTYPNYELVIVDNDSKEEETLRYLEATPHRRLQYPGEFRYAAMTNYAVRETTGKYVILLNNDTAVLNDEWIEAMLEHAQRPGVAAVGARLLYPDGRPQHEGIVMGAGIGGSCLNVDTRGYFGLGSLVRNVSAVTAACMMVSRQAFEELGGFDESLCVAFNDVDYCLRALKARYRVIYTPYATLVHHESASRGSLHPREDEEFFRRRWGKPGEYRDAYYNPNLSRAVPYTIETDWPTRQEPQRKPIGAAIGPRV